MKFCLSSLVALFVCVSAQAFAVSVTTCEGQTLGYILKAEQTGADVRLTLVNDHLIKQNDISHPTEGKYQTSAQLMSVEVLHNANLQDFIAKRHLSVSAIVQMMYGRWDLDGEQDMFYANAGDLFKSLVCK